jgi:hypothetical protein
MLVRSAVADPGVPDCARGAPQVVAMANSLARRAAASKVFAGLAIFLSLRIPAVNAQAGTAHKQANAPIAVDAGGHWWEREEIRIIDLIASTNQIAARDPAALAGRKAELGFNAEHFEVMNMPAGLDDRGFVFRSSVTPAPISRDYLGEYLPEAHKRGIRVLIYFNVHWSNQTFAREHPGLPSYIHTPSRK